MKCDINSKNTTHLLLDECTDFYKRLENAVVTIKSAPEEINQLFDPLLSLFTKMIKKAKNNPDFHLVDSLRQTWIEKISEIAREKNISEELDHELFVYIQTISIFSLKR